ncbi:MAG TPA: exosortase/archaeosortase family protein [Gemmatimonadales bacterium]|nr:exosortase/archaeosortase family protein [Gemmatimonadales bacterium]
MTDLAPPAPVPVSVAAPWWESLAPATAAALAFTLLFFQPFTTLVRDWLTDPDAGHGLLLFPVAVWLAWRVRRGAVIHPRPALGLVVLIGAILLRFVGGLAVELFTMRVAMLGAAMGLVIYFRGLDQLRRWWLPTILLTLAIPLPAVVLGSLALPLQFKASQMGAALLASRHVPVELTGNVIHLPGRSLFVTEACSGLRSLTALVSLGLLTGGVWLTTVWGRIVLLGATLPVAMLLNGIRIFLTGFLVYYVDPALGDGFMHVSEGWAIFVAAFAILGGLAWVLHVVERSRRRSTS